MVGLVLAIACSNLATLLLVRGHQRGVADARQQQRRNGHAGALGHLRGVAAHDQTKRIGEASGMLGMRGHGLSILSRPK